MLDKNFWFLLQFPYNLLFVFLFYWIHSETNKKSLPLLVIFSVFVVTGLWLEGIPNIFFWIPSGVFTVVIATTFTLFYFNFYSPKHKKALKIPTNVSWSRDSLKKELLNVDSYDERQRIYLDFVKKLNCFLVKIENELSLQVNSYFIILLALLFCINFGYWFFDYSIDKFNITQLFDKSRLENLIPNEGTRTEILKFYDTYKQTFINYSASLTMVFNTFSLFFILPIIRWMESKKNEMSFFWLDLCFFRLPESTILIYIPIIFLLIISLYYNILTQYSYWFRNLAFIFSFLYFINGFAILRTYAKVRFLPFGVILLIVFLSSWFIPQFLLLAIFSLFLVGLLDFAFNIKKKALHDISLRIKE